MTKGYGTFYNFSELKSSKTVHYPFFYIRKRKLNEKNLVITPKKKHKIRVNIKKET